MIQKLSFSFPQKAFRINRFANSVIPKQLLQPKLVNSVRPSQFGGTETARVSQSPELGHTDFQFSVRPRITCAMALAESVEPSSITRLVRDGFGGNLTLNFQFTSNLRSVFGE